MQLYECSRYYLYSRKSEIQPHCDANSILEDVILCFNRSKNTTVFKDEKELHFVSTFRFLIIQIISCLLKEIAILVRQSK